MVQVMLPTLLATQAGAQRRFEIDAGTVGEALRALPVADLVMRALLKSDPYLLVYVNDTNAAECGGMASPVKEQDEIRVISVLAGG
jgi:molybdopterin converting factor small subunit